MICNFCDYLPNDAGVTKTENRCNLAYDHYQDLIVKCVKFEKTRNFTDQALYG